MIEVVIDSIRISLVSQHRIIVLKEMDSERRLPIWIGACEADAITMELQDVKIARPVTHDLLIEIISEMGGTISHVMIKALNEDVFYAGIFVDKNEDMVEVDCRSSDAIAVAVRANCPIFIAPDVMEEAGIYPERGISDEDEPLDDGESDGDMGAFADFMDSLDFDE